MRENEVEREGVWEEKWTKVDSKSKHGDKRAWDNASRLRGKDRRSSTSYLFPSFSEKTHAKNFF